MADLAMVMPMAGRGSRFAREGVLQPKPLVALGGKPFFWWATESVRRMAGLGEMVFVVLEEHVRDFAIDDRIHRYYPHARVIALPDVTSGAAETAAIGLRALRTSGPVAINDSDHAFACRQLGAITGALGSEFEAALLCFEANSPAYSYAQLDEAQRVTGTVEKQVVSRYAIAGCYLFAEPGVFLKAYEDYRHNCPYDELFVSGVYNRLIASGGRVGKVVATRHVSFGTPEELARVDPSSLSDPEDWLGS